MLRRGMYTVAVLLLGAAVGAAQLPPVPPTEAPAPGGALLSVEVAGPASVAPDQPVAYEITVRNTGANAVAHVRIDDVLPPGAKLRSADPQPEVQSDHLTWDLGYFDPGVERRIKLEIQAGTDGEVNLAPTASFTPARGCHTRIVRPPFGVTQTVAETAPRGPVTIQIHVTNNSAQVVNQIQLYDTLPPGLVNPHGDKIICDIASLAPGETKTINLEAQAVQSGRLTNRVTAQADGGLKADSEASVLIMEAPLVVRLDAPPQLAAGQDVSLQLEVSNPGTTPAANVRVQQVIPDGVAFVSASTGGTMDAARRAAAWSLGTLAPGQQQMLTLTVRGQIAGDWIFKTTATADGAPEAPAFATLHIDGAPKLLVEIVRHEAAIDLGAESDYEVRVLNQGTTAAANVRLIATVSAGLLMQSATGPTNTQVQPQQIVFEPLPQLPGRAATMYRLHIKGQTAGDWGLAVQATADQLAKPLNQQVTTRVVAK